MHELLRSRNHGDHDTSSSYVIPSMLAFRLCRITATLVHRAYFLLLADFLIGSRWFFINGFTALIDLLFAPTLDSLWNFTELLTIGAALGMTNPLF